MKIVFLDVDGVLNANRPVGEEMSLKMKNWVLPDAMARLNQIVEQTGADIVVSSTWRIGKRRTELQEDLNSYGFTGRVRGMTDRLPCSYHEGMTCSQGHRGAEIGAWVDAHDDRIESFVILDDDSDMGALLHRLVHTVGSEGLQDGDVERAIKMLQ